MSDRETFIRRGYQIKPTVVHCMFQPSTAGPTVNTSASRGVASVSRVSAGLFRITCQDAYRARGPVCVSIEHANASTDLAMQVAAVTNIGTTTPAVIDVRIKQGSTTKDVPLATTTWVHVMAAFENSSEA